MSYAADMWQWQLAIDAWYAIVMDIYIILGIPLIAYAIWQKLRRST
ncbi:hypothetical protein M0R72_08395 [Candidatus Pacearchaeota archaeon]|jgi:hypothetical protein|nr:hypothetical protein [Candidatus Pacearchaeota archaeon]